MKYFVLLALVASAAVAFADETSTTTPAPTPNPNFDCTDGDGFYSHPEDCTKYFQCFAGNAWELVCSGGLYFNPKTEQCDYKENVDCSNDSAEVYHGIHGQECLEPVDTYNCTDDGAFPHEEFCEYYYDCYKGMAWICRCTEGYLFDTTYNGCNFPESVHCNGLIRPNGTDPEPTSPKPTTEKTTLPPWTGPTTTEEPSDEFVCPKPNGYWRDPQDCGMYYRCVDDYPYHNNCPPGLVFNEKLELCDHLANVPECQE